MTRNRGSEKTGYKIILILLIALAALSNAIKDLNSLQQLIGSLQEVTSEWFGDGLIMVNARKDNSLGANSCSYEAAAPLNSTDEFRWNGRLAPGKAIEIKGLNGEIKSEPAAGTDIEVIANKKGHRSDPSVVKIQVVKHPDGVTIYAIYPSSDL